MPNLTQKQAWEKIAQAFDRYANGDNVEHVEEVTGVEVTAGMCYTLTMLRYRDIISPDTKIAMAWALEQHNGDAGWGYWWETWHDGERVGREGAANRAMFAQLMAEVID